MGTFVVPMAPCVGRPPPPTAVSRDSRGTRIAGLIAKMAELVSGMAGVCGELASAGLEAGLPGVAEVARGAAAQCEAASVVVAEAMAGHAISRWTSRTWVDALEMDPGAPVRGTPDLDPPGGSALHGGPQKRPRSSPSERTQVKKRLFAEIASGTPDGSPYPVGRGDGFTMARRKGGRRRNKGRPPDRGGGGGVVPYPGDTGGTRKVEGSDLPGTQAGTGRGGHLQEVPHRRGTQTLGSSVAQDPAPATAPRNPPGVRIRRRPEAVMAKVVHPLMYIEVYRVLMTKGRAAMVGVTAIKRSRMGHVLIELSKTSSANKVVEELRDLIGEQYHWPPCRIGRRWSCGIYAP